MGRRLANPVDVEPIAAALTVLIEPHAIRLSLKERSDLVLEGCGMGIRPLELGENAI